MFYALSWLAVLTLFGLWSLAVWALHAVAVWIVSHAGALSETASGIGNITLPDWLAPWVPTEVVQVVTQLAKDLAPLIDSLLQATPALAGGLTIVTWGVWAIGGVLLLLLGAGLHLLIAMWLRRRNSSPGTGSSLARS